MSTLTATDRRSSATIRSRRSAFTTACGWSCATLTIDYDPLCFTQGEITAVAEDGSWFDVRIDKGYPVTGLAANRVQFYDPQTRLLKRNSITTYTSNYSELKQLGHNLFRAVKNGTWSAASRSGIW